MSKVVWKDIPGFPNYIINEEGEIYSEKTGTTLRPAINQTGILGVALFIDGKLHRRSVALLVADTFVPRPEQPHFDTPTHLDGDKTNVRADNLVWRPRWFAIKFHQQFHPSVEYDKWNDVHILKDEPDSFFGTALECASRYGVLVRDLVLAAHNGNAVPFGGFNVRLDTI